MSTYAPTKPIGPGATMLRGLISVMPIDQRTQIEECYVELKDYLDKHEHAAVIAMSLIGVEMQEENTE